MKTCTQLPDSEHYLRRLLDNYHDAATVAEGGRR
jgi:hypothetical protein